MKVLCTQEQAIKLATAVLEAGFNVDAFSYWELRDGVATFNAIDIQSIALRPEPAPTFCDKPVKFIVVDQ